MLQSFLDFLGEAGAGIGLIAVTGIAIYAIKKLYDIAKRAIELKK